MRISIGRCARRGDAACAWARRRTSRRAPSRFTGRRRSSTGTTTIPWALRGLDPGRDFAKADISKPVPKLMTDIPRLRQGGVGGQFWSVYVPSSMQGKEAVRATLEQIDIVHRMVMRWPETFQIAYTAADIERSFKAKHIGSLIGVEGGHSIDNSLATLRMLYTLGAQLHDADPLREPRLGRRGHRQAGARRPDEVRRRSRPRDESPRHARRPEPRVARHDGRRAARHRSAGDLLAFVGEGDLQRASQRARQRPADRREEWRRGDGDVRARLHFAGGRRLRREARGGAQRP